MRSAAQFLTLLVVGVLIVLIYNRSGDSLLVLIITLLTVMVLLALYVLRPWELAAERNLAREQNLSRVGDLDREEEVAAENNPAKMEQTPPPAKVNAKGKGKGKGQGQGQGQGPERPKPIQSKPSKKSAKKRIKKRATPAKNSIPQESQAPKNPIWRAKFDVSSNEQELSGVPVGQRRSQTWPWAHIEAIGSDWCEEMVGTEVKAKLGIRLDFPETRNPAEATSAMLALGPRQVLDDVIAEARTNWRSSKILRSRYYELGPEERTRMLFTDLGAGALGLDDLVSHEANGSSANVVYREGAKALLRTGQLCRLTRTCDAAELLEAFDTLLAERGVARLSQDEADDLLDGALSPDAVASGYELIDWMAQLRACRAAFIDHGGQDYLLGLLSSESANHWDGQFIGEGAAQVLLDVPR